MGMKNKKTRRVVLAFSLFIGLVLVFNVGVQIGYLVADKSENSSINEAESTKDENSSEDSLLSDENFISTLKKTLSNQADVKHVPEDESVHVIPTDEDLIDALNNVAYNQDNLEFWEEINLTFLELSNYTDMNIIMVNPVNQEYMLLWVVQGLVKYDFVQELNTNSQDATQIVNVLNNWYYRSGIKCMQQ
ncbi:hypothetical protein [Mycoplasma sp. P36-A1]|uniref:hypothetical protein n=1 Tax=Mycoplasma sp. P36-A1 TaxID=3252900 RepID=UPI003C2EC459